MFKLSSSSLFSHGRIHAAVHPKRSFFTPTITNIHLAFPSSKRRERSRSFCKCRAELWASQQSSALKALSLEKVAAIHKYSYSHKNRRTLLLYVSDNSVDDGNMLSEVERLATGLQHETNLLFCSLRLNDRESQQYATQVLNMKSTPAIYIFPEGRRGFARYKGDIQADALLTAMNKICAPLDLDPFQPSALDFAARRQWEMQGEPLRLVALPEDAARKSVRYNPGAEKIEWLLTLGTWLLWAVCALVLVKLAISAAAAAGLEDRERREAMAEAVVTALRSWQADVAARFAGLWGALRGLLAVMVVGLKQLTRKQTSRKGGEPGGANA